METTLGDGGQGGGEGFPRQVIMDDAQQRQQQQNPQRYRFSPEELRVLKECNRESFWFRSLPFGTFLGSLAYMAVKNGYLNPNPRFGATPKTLAFATLGYFVGKVSYQPRCMEKLMNLPNSQLAEYLKRQKGQGRLGIQESLTLEPEFYTANQPGPEEPQQDLRSDVMDTMPLNSFDNESTQHYSAIEIGRPTDATEQMLNDENLPPPRQQYGTTYDDLRRQNRIEYETFRSRGPPPAEAPRRPPPPPPSAGPSKRKNQYGDDWEEVK